MSKKLTFSLFGAKRRSRFPAPRSSGPHFLTSRGFTILEALVALLILTIGLLGLLRVMPVGLKASRTGRDVTIATQLAQQKLDETRTAAWPATGTTSGNFGSEGYSNFEYILEITAATNVNLREATVSVSWPAGASSQRTVALKTHMAKYD